MLQFSQGVDICIFGNPANPDYTVWPKLRKLDKHGKVDQVRQGISVVFHANTPDNRDTMDLAGNPLVKGCKIPLHNVPKGLSKEDRLKWLIGHAVESVRASWCRDLTGATGKKGKSKVKPSTTTAPATSAVA